MLFHSRIDWELQCSKQITFDILWMSSTGATFGKLLGQVGDTSTRLLTNYNTGVGKTLCMVRIFEIHKYEDLQRSWSSPTIRWCGFCWPCEIAISTTTPRNPWKPLAWREVNKDLLGFALPSFSHGSQCCTLQIGTTACLKVESQNKQPGNHHMIMIGVIYNYKYT